MKTFWLIGCLFFSVSVFAQTTHTTDSTATAPADSTSPIGTKKIVKLPANAKSSVTRQNTEDLSPAEKEETPAEKKED